MFLFCRIIKQRIVFILKIKIFKFQLKYILNRLFKKLFKNLLFFRYLLIVKIINYLLSTQTDTKNRDFLKCRYNHNRWSTIARVCITDFHHQMRYQAF